MLDWLTADQRLQYAEESKLMDAPETPAPVFALRAFKSLFQGSPDKDEQTLLQAKNDCSDTKDGHAANDHGTVRHPELVSPSKPAKRQSLEAISRLPRTSSSTESPMKSILLASPRKIATPGTAKKNVSFREALHTTKREKHRHGKSGGMQKVERTRLPKHTGKSNTTEKADEVGLEREEMFTTSKGKDAAEPGPVEPSKNHLASKQGVFGVKDEHNRLFHSKSNSSTKERTTEAHSEQASKSSPLSSPSSDAIAPSPDEMSDYISRTNREVKKLVRAIQSMRSYARKKDQEASQLQARMARQSAENKKLLAENQAMKKKLKALEEKLAAREQGKFSIKSECAAALRRHEPVTNKNDPDMREGGVSNATAPLPSASAPAHEGTLNVTVAGVPEPDRLDPRNDTPPLRLSSANGRVRMAPDRLEAAKARLRVKSEERRKTWGSPVVEAEKGKENA